MLLRYTLSTALLIITLTVTQAHAVVYPMSTPTGEITGGAFRTYFDNMFASGTVHQDCSATLQVVAGFDNMGVPICVTPTAAGFSLLGQTAGDTVRFDGTDWIRTNFLYNNGTNIGIGTITPTATLDVNGQIRLRGGSPAIGKILMSDATGIATWYDPLPSLSGSFWAIGGNSVTSIQNMGTTTNYSLPFTTNNVERMRILTNGNVGIGVINPTAMLEIAGQIKINGGTPGLGKVLTSDAAGLASWVTPTVATSSETLALSGALVGTPNYVAKYTPTGTGINNSQIYDNGTNVGIGTSFPSYKLDIMGDVINNGWYRSRGPTGWYNETYGGTLSMWDSQWIRTNTSLWADYLIGGNQGLTIGVGGTTPPVGGALIAGNVGIGTSVPNSNVGINKILEVAGLGSAGITLTDANTPTSKVNIFNTNGGLYIYQNNFGYLLSATTAGNIGIGTTTPGAKLEVAGQIKITGGGIGSGKILVSDATGLASWQSSVPASSVNAANITGGTGYYIPYFGSGGTGLFSSFLYYTGSRLGVNTTNPQYMVDIKGSGSILNAGSGLCINDTCINTWSGLNNIVRSMGTPNYIAKFDTAGMINNSQLYETGGKLYIGDIPAILGGAATVGYITVESLGSTNSSNPLLTLSENGGQECRMWINGANKIGSNCEWTAGTSGFGFLPNQVPRADATGDSLTGGTIFNVGNNVGIGNSSPSSTLDVTGNTHITGDLTVQGKVITDTIVNRTVANVSISGSLLPDAAAPMIYRNMGSLTQRWNNLYLSGQVTIGGGSPGAGKILTSDATGLATWSNGFSGAITASGITGGTEGYITKFGTGGNGIVNSLFYETGAYVALGSTTPTSRFEIWSGATTTLFHMRGTNNLGIGSAAVRYQTTGSANVGIGPNALRTLTTGYSNAAIGEGALYGTTQGYFNAAVGAQALYSNNIGNWNVAMGNQALWTNLDGNYNVALGGQALYSNSANDANIAIGYQALRATVADNNIGIGYSAGSGITSGTNNIIIGTNTQAQSNTASNQLNIGNWIYGSGGNIGIGTGTNLLSKFTIDSGINNTSGLRISRIVATTPVFAGVAAPLGVDGSGNVVVAQQGAIPVYTALGATQNAAINTTTNPPTIGANYDKYFNINARQAFTVTDVGGNPYNCPEFTIGSVNKGATGCTATPWATYVMTAQNATSGNRYGYQILISDRTDAPFVVRGGTYDPTAGKLMNTARTIEALWFKALTVPTNHNDWLYINPGVDQNNNPISGGGDIGIGTINPNYGLDIRTSVGMSNTLQITSGTPGVGKVLTSDATGNATWETPSGGSGVGVCTIASVTITNTAAVRTCTGIPASTAVAVTCTPNGAFSTPNTTAINCRANGTADSVTCNTTAANTNARTYTCMWAQ